MRFLSSLLEIIGFGIGIPFGLFIYLGPCPCRDVLKGTYDPVIKPLHQLDSNALDDLVHELPLWVKNSVYDRVDWLNRFISDMWSYVDKAVCSMIRRMAEPIFAEYTGKFQLKSIDFEELTLGTFPPTLHGVKIYETDEKELVFQPIVTWAGNSNVTVVLKLLSLPVVVQLVDFQIFAAPRVTLKPLVPTFPCFANIMVSLMEKPQIDFGMNILGCDVMAIPGLYHHVQETIRKQIASFSVWPQILQIPILDHMVGATKKPVGILHVKVVRAERLMKMDILGTSDPYVKLSLSGERLPTKKTTIKMRNLNPEWIEHFKLIVKDPELQVLQMQVYDWDVGSHDKLGMQIVPLGLLVPQETKSFKLDLLKNMNPEDPHNQKQRGKIVVELTFHPFRDDSRFSGPLDGHSRKSSLVESLPENLCSSGAGLLLVTIQGAKVLEGKHHNNPFAVIHFRGEMRKTKMIRKTRDPFWNEEFEFMLDEDPLNDKIHIEVISKKTGFSFRRKELLGHVDIYLIDVVYNGHINQRYDLINSKNGIIHVEIRWKTI